MRRTLFVLAFLAGCSELTSPPTDRGDVGHYDLASVDGRSLPRPTSYGFYYWSGSIELRADFTFVDVIVMGDAKRATVVDSVFGTWRAVGDSLRMTPDDWTPYSIRRNLDQVSVRWDGAFIYQRTH